MPTGTVNTNTQLLGEILLDLDELLENQRKGNENSGNEKEITLKIEGNEDVVALLSGLGVLNSDSKEGDKKGGDTASQLKDIINLLDKLKDIDESKIASVAKSVKELSVSLTDLKVTEKQTSGLSSVSQFLVAVAGLDASGIKNIGVIAAALTPDAASQMAGFINAFKLSAKSAQYAAQTVYALAYMLQVINQIDAAKIEAQMKALKSLDKESG